MLRLVGEPSDAWFIVKTDGEHGSCVSAQASQLALSGRIYVWRA
jgi:hypothetical protein